MNLAALTLQQRAYVPHRIDHADDEPLPHPGSPRQQSLDRIADQLAEQLDGEELQDLRDMAAGKRPRGADRDEESGRDVDAELIAEPEAAEEPLTDLEAYIARAFPPSKRRQD